MSTVATLLSMIELGAPGPLVQEQATLIVRRVGDISQGILHQEDLWKTREWASLENERNL
jgi:hypothetical protein